MNFHCGFTEGEFYILPRLCFREGLCEECDQTHWGIVFQFLFVEVGIVFT